MQVIDKIYRKYNSSANLLYKMQVIDKTKNCKLLVNLLYKMQIYYIKCNII